MEDAADEYGPAFDADEEAILSRLLTQASITLPLRPAVHNGTTNHVGDGHVAARRYALRPRRSDGPHAAGQPGVVVAYEPTEDGDAMQDVRVCDYHDDRSNDTTQPRNMTRDEVRGDHLVEDGVLPDPRKTPGPEDLPTVDEGERARDVDVTMRPPNAGTGTVPKSPPRFAPSTEEDTRSPLERFRPRGRPLSVTDLISPAWCEQQWAFVLSKHGRKRTTPAMAAGTRVHRRLEAEVHVRMSIDVESREDAFGLRIWNAIQGLRTLRETGVTRELEVWGMIDGRVVNGVIDQLSYVCPDTELEKPQDPKLAHGQMTLGDFFKHQRREAEAVSAAVEEETATSLQEDADAPSLKRLRTMGSLRATTDRVYICDVKTRANPSVPRGAAFRPTLLQLMLYRYLLGQMAGGDGGSGADITSITRALRLDANAHFTDTFLAELGGLGTTSSVGSSLHALSQDGGDPLTQSSSSLFPSQHSASSDYDALDLLLDHATLRKLWQLLRAECAATFPRGAASCGDVLKAEYRDPDAGGVRGLKTFRYSEPLVREYVANVMQWWRGERAPQGVERGEAYKCRYCDFADDCDWRKGMVDEDTARFREMNGKPASAAATTAAVDGKSGKGRKKKPKEEDLKSEMEMDTDELTWERTRSQV